VAGFIAAMISDRGAGEVINIGSNFEISIGDTVKAIAEIMGCDVQIEADDQRLRPKKSEVERLWASNALAVDLLDWLPAYSGEQGFRRGLAETVDWFLQPDNLNRYKSDIYNL
jgi:dTDP-glucose 4,6-dehydratase